MKLSVHENGESCYTFPIIHNGSWEYCTVPFNNQSDGYRQYKAKKRAIARAKIIANAVNGLPSYAIADWLEERGHKEAADDLRRNF